MLAVLAASNAGGVWFGTAHEGTGLSGWLTLLAVVVVIGGLCWLGDWAVRRRSSGVEARSSTKDTVDRLVGGVLQTYRN